VVARGNPGREARPLEIAGGQAVVPAAQRPQLDIVDEGLARPAQVQIDDAGGRRAGELVPQPCRRRHRLPVPRRIVRPKGIDALKRCAGSVRGGGPGRLVIVSKRFDREALGGRRDGGELEGDLLAAVVQT